MLISILQLPAEHGSTVFPPAIFLHMSVVATYRYCHNMTYMRKVMHHVCILNILIAPFCLAGVEHLAFVPFVGGLDNYGSNCSRPCAACLRCPSYIVDPATLTAYPIQSPWGNADPALLTSCNGTPCFITTPSSDAALEITVQEYRVDQNHWKVQRTKGLSRDNNFNVAAGVDEHKCILGIRSDGPWLLDIRRTSGMRLALDLIKAAWGVPW